MSKYLESFYLEIIDKLTALKLVGFGGLLVAFTPFSHAYNEQDSDYLMAVDPALGIGSGFGRWDGSINLVYDPDGAPDLFSNQNDVLSLLEEATQEWEQVSGIQFNVTGSDSNAVDDDGLGPDSKDGLVRVHWANTGGAAGRAGPDGDFFDTDIGYFPYIDGSVELNENPSIWDSQSELVQVMVHELGHLMGLGHSDNPDSVMYANPYNHLRHPRADDILAARAMYGLDSMSISDVTQPQSQWLYEPLPNASTSATEFLFEPNQATDQGAFVSVGSDTPVTVITDSQQDGVFVRFNLGGIGNFNANADINVDTTIAFVDPFGYLYALTDREISCDDGFACDGGWVSVTSSHVIKTIPGEWKIYVEDDNAGTTLLELPFTVNTQTDFNQPPVADVTVTGISSTTVNIALDVSDSDSNTINVVWHPLDFLEDLDGDGFIDAGITDTTQSGNTVSREFSFPRVDTHTFYIELKDTEARYDGSNADSSSAGDGFQTLISITVNLPLASDNDVTVITSFLNGSSSEGDSDSGSMDQVVDAIARTSTLEVITTSDGSSSSAGFGAGASSDSGSSTATDFSGSDSITIAGSVTPQLADVGDAGEIFVVLFTNTDIGLSTLDVDGNFQTWSGSLKTIEPAYEISSLSSVENFAVFDGSVQSGLYRVFLGYRLTAGGPIHFNAKAFRVTVD
ncbi:MAG: matrixin family metalloprotease [Gammaproteobacteria bacterium]|nr:matrixin family metalloprotease [Gammaproteobacteria bacterium]